MLAWAAILLIALPFAPRAVDALRAGGFILDDLESARAKAVLQAELGAPPSAIVVVLHSDSLLAGTPAFEAAAAEAIAGVADAPYVARIVPHTLATRQVSADGHTAYDVVLLTIAPDDSPAALPGIEAALRRPAGMEVALAGGPAFYGDVQEVSESDLRRSEVISLPLAAIALLIVFGSVVAGVLPLAVGGAAVVVALATIYAVASATPMSIFVLNLATLLGLGLGVDYSLLLTSRFREQIAAGRPDDPDLVPRAVEETVATAGRAVFFSRPDGAPRAARARAVRVHDPALGRDRRGDRRLPRRRLGGDLASGAAGDRRNPDRRAVDPPDDAERRAGRPLGAPRPVGHAPPGRGPDPDARPPAPARLRRSSTSGSTPRTRRSCQPASRPAPRSTDWPRPFGEGEFAPLTLAIRTDGPATSPENLAALYAYSRRLAADPRVTRVEGLVDVDQRLGLDQYQLLYGDPNGPRDRFIAMALAATTKDDLTTFTVFTPFGPNRGEGRELVAALRDEAGPLAPPAGIEVLVGGGAADVADVVDRVAADFPRTALFIIMTTYIVLFVLLRSAVLPIKALVMNTLSIVASFGALVWIFQDGNLSSVLGFQPLGFVETTQPVILFCVLFGLSMDYEVFLLSRMKEVWDQTHDNTEAVARGLERSGRIVTSAALIVVVVAGSFAFADIVLIKALGIGMAIAVALDATVVRALLVPATMRLLGKWNWWAPEWARRVPAVGTAVLLLALVLAGCTGPILAAPPAAHPTTPPAPTDAARPADPQPIGLPRDDAPHDRLTEWWYYTGHLHDDDGGGTASST